MSVNLEFNNRINIKQPDIMRNVSPVWISTNALKLLHRPTLPSAYLSRKINFIVRLIKLVNFPGSRSHLPVGQKFMSNYNKQNKIILVQKVY
jgi:hypothetical protein